MKWVIPIAAVLLLGCAQDPRVIPPAPKYVLALPDKNSVWVGHVEKGFLAGCEQMRMECTVVRYSGEESSIVELLLEQGDTKGAPLSIGFESSEPIKEVTDALSLENREAITIGADDSTAYRAGHVGPDAKRLASMVATRSQALDPPARRILYVVGSAPVDARMLEASAFRESDQWRKYRPRIKLLAAVTEEDFQWCDLVVPIGEDAQAKAVASAAKRIFPTEPTDASIALLKSGRAKYVIANNYFDIGLRASRIARERAVYSTIAKAILPISPKEVDEASVSLYLETRFKVPPITRQPPEPKAIEKGKTTPN